MPVRNLPKNRKTIRKELAEQERIEQWKRETNLNHWLKGLDVDLNSIPDSVGGYRADPTGRYGGKEGLETLPTKLNAAELYAKVKAMKLGEQYGVPQLSPQQLAALALKEGQGLSGVFGVDPVVPKSALSKDPQGVMYSLNNNTDYDAGMKGDKELYEKLISQGISGKAAAFAVRLANKNKVAERLGIPFESAWVGTGHSGVESSNEYADSMKQFQIAANHPKNRKLIDFISTALIPPTENYKYGGMIENTTHNRKII